MVLLACTRSVRERLTFCDLGFLPFSAVPRTAARGPGPQCMTETVNHPTPAPDKAYLCASLSKILLILERLAQRALPKRPRSSWAGAATFAEHKASWQICWISLDLSELCLGTLAS